MFNWFLFDFYSLVHEVWGVGDLLVRGRKVLLFYQHGFIFRFWEGLVDVGTLSLVSRLEFCIMLTEA